MKSLFGKELEIEVWGASHAPEIGITVKGLPIGKKIDVARINSFLDRRKGGKNAYSTKRAEADLPDIQTGGSYEEGQEFILNGEPLTAIFYNQNTRSSDYDEMKYVPRPSHADYTSYVKYGDALDRSGGGIFSGRLTLPLCFAGAICMQLMEEEGIDIFGHVASVGPVNDSMFDKIAPDKSAIGQNETSFPTIDPEAAEKMVAFMTECASEGDSVGGTIECAVTGLPAGVGEPLYDSMEAVISHMMFGIPAIKGIAFGSGFACSEMKGSECNDPFIIKDGRVQTETNNSGGIQGGISNGMPVIFRVAVKPTPSIFKEQKSVNMKELTETTLSLKGRHDPCIVPRALPCVEAACAIAVYNLLCEYHKLRITQGREERSGELKELRIQIDRLDDQIAHLLAERMDVASEIGKLKAKENMPIRNVGREAEVLLHVAGIAGEEKGEYVKEVYRTLIAQTSKYEEEQ